MTPHVPAIGRQAASRFAHRTAPSLPLRLAARLAAAVGLWYRRRRTRLALGSLSERELSDIGLTRTGYGAYEPLDGSPPFRRYR